MSWPGCGRHYPFASDEVCCQKTSISFGDSIQELLGPLLQGIRMVLIPDEVLKDLPRFVQTLALHRVTRLILVPSLLRALLDTYGDLPGPTAQPDSSGLPGEKPCRAISGNAFGSVCRTVA